MKNVTKLLAATFIIGVFCTINSFAQTDAKTPEQIVGAVFQSGTDTQAKKAKTSEAKNTIGALTLCWSEPEATDVPVSYRLKVWQLMQGQTAETAMSSNQAIVSASYHAINTKGAGSGDRMVAGNNSDAMKGCTQNLEAQEHAIKTKGMGGERTVANTSTVVTVKPMAIQTKGAGGDKVGRPSIIRTITVENFTACAKGNSCDYVGTLEELGADGNLVASKPRKFIRIRKDDLLLIGAP